MGYTTQFSGQFHINRPLTEAQARYLVAFAGTRRMKRNSKQAERMPDPIRMAVGLPIGEDGAYFVGGTGFCGQDEDASVLDYGAPPRGQPNLWCGWAPSEDRQAILWDGVEKFSAYVEWLEYLIKHFIQPWGYTLNGEVAWAGEDYGDAGGIEVTDNHVRAKKCPDCRDPALWSDN